MTLKQFGYLAGGALVALLFYSLPLAGFIKWPLILFFGFLSFAFAFMPIEERPLSTWFLAFTKAIFSPTLFVWQKKAKKLEIFEPVIRQAALLKTPTPLPDIQKLGQYLETLPVDKAKTPLDEKEEEFFQQINSLFTAPQATIKPSKLPVFTFPPVREIPKEKEQLTKKPPSKPLPKPPIEAFIYPPPPRPKKPKVEAKISKELPIPIPPSAPNIISGMVFDKNGEILEGAILEIRNSQGMPVRALKTNKLGQFIIATPLENGKYEIEVEKENHNFDIIKFEAKGEMISPFEIRAK